MSALAASLPAYALTPTEITGGSITFTLAGGEAWRLQALAFQVDLNASAQADDIWVEARAQNGALIVGQVVGAAQAAGTIVAYTLSPFLNPCDGIVVSPSIGLSPDTFPPLTLTEGCSLSVQALTSAAAGLDTDAVIGEGLAWVEGLGSRDVLSGAPLFVPIPLDEQGALVGAGSGVGG